MKGALVTIAGVSSVGIVLCLLLLLPPNPQQTARPRLSEDLEPLEVEGQPLASNVQRLIQALEFLGTPLPVETTHALQTAIRDRNAREIQQLLDPQVLFVVRLNPEVRVKVTRG